MGLDIPRLNSVGSADLSPAFIMDCHSQDEGFITESQTIAASRRSWMSGLIVGAAGMAALVGVAGTAAKGMSSNLSGLQNKEERVQIVPSYPACSKAGENCMASHRLFAVDDSDGAPPEEACRLQKMLGCCQTSGHKCFTKGEGKAQCNKTCTVGVKGFTCNVIGTHSVPVSTPLGQNLCCFSLYTENTGNETLVSHELELLNIVAAQGKGIFACEQWDVFSDVSVPIDHTNGYVTIKVEDKFGEFHQLKRKDSGTWVNWGIFYQIWVKIRELGRWQAADYTIKVDADAVFLPGR